MEPKISPRLRSSSPRYGIQAKPVNISWNPSVSVFAKEEYLRSVGDEYGWLGGIDESGQLRCFLPYTITHRALFRLVRFHVQTIPWGAEIKVEEERAFLEGVVNHFKSIGSDIIIPPTTNTLFRIYPNGADAAPYCSYVNDLTLSEEALWGNLNSVYRKKIRHSQKLGVRILMGAQYLSTAYDIICNTLAHSSMKFMSFGSLKRLVDGLEDNVRVFVAEYNGTVQGCTIFPFSNYSAYSLYGGRIQTADSGAMNLLNWDAMLHFKRSGVQRLDFMGGRVEPEPGSKQEGILTFKQRFGGQLMQGFIWRYPLRPLGSLAYSLGVRVLRGGDIVDAERHKLTRPKPSA